MRNATSVCWLLAATAVIAVGCGEQRQRGQSLTTPTGLDGTAAKGGKPVGDLPVTTIIESVDANGFLADLSTDGQGPYSDGIDGVSSVLLANAVNNLTHGDWTFLAPTIRKIGRTFDQEDAVPPTDISHYIAPAIPPFWGTQTLPGKLQIKCTNENKSMLTMTAGASFTCGLLTDLTTTDGIDYGLQMAPVVNGFTETTPVQVVCNGTDSVGCKDWFVEPIAGGQAVARLVHREATGKGRGGTTQVIDGDFYLRFRVHITRP
jgi:hypothetical protein